MSKDRFRNEFSVQQADLAKLFDKLPPHALEAEMSLLGSMIVAGAQNIHVLGEVMQMIRKASDFYLPKHAQIYQCLIELYDQHQAVDTIQLTQRLRDLKQLDGIGGIDYLVELAESVPTAVNAPHFARIVRDQAKRRELIEVAARILAEAHESPEPTGDVLNRAESEIFRIAQTASPNDPEAISALVHEAFEALMARKDSGASLTGLSTGYYELDEMLSGLQKGEMLILAARPSMGKTSLALNIAENVAVLNKQPVAIFSLEMSKQQLSDRLLSSQSGVDAQRMRRNMLTEDDMARLRDAAAGLAEAPMYIDDTPGLTVMDLRAKARRLKTKEGIQAIVIDYLQLMSAPGSENRVQEVGLISRGVKALARELSVPVICLSQLNRNPEGRESKRPMLSDLRESGSIEQDADVVMMLHREDYYHHDDAWREENADKIGVSELILAKQRNGPTGTVNLMFNRETTRFENLAHNVDLAATESVPPF